MKIQKRDGRLVDFSAERVQIRIDELMNDQKLGKLETIDSHEVILKVYQNVSDKIKTSELDEISARIAIELSSNNLEYAELSTRIIISNNHKNTSDSFSEVMNSMYNNLDVNGKHSPVVSYEFIKNVRANSKKFDNYIDYLRDYKLGGGYFGFKTLERSYLTKLYGRNDENKIVERPQYMYMRVAIGIWGDNYEMAIRTYDLLSQGYYTHATPTLFNAGMPRSQLSSCFLLHMEDSVNGIYKTLTDCAKISKWSGGIGIHISDIRAKDSIIRGTNGKSDGIVPMLKVFNETALYINQSSKRKGSIAAYMEIWHADILDFLNMGRNHGDDKVLARDLFYALWVCDLFMEQLNKDDYWYLMCPDECKGLTDLYGEEFEELYWKYVEKGKYRKKIKAKELMLKIIDIQTERGTPYIGYKDHFNKRNNQSNIGVIKGSNLCTEIALVTNKDEIAVCNLCSIALPKYVKDGKFDYQVMYETVKHATRSLNMVIDKNYNPVPEGSYSNLKNRPIGIGVQGLADTYALLRLPFESEEARDINRKIFETIYFAATETSMELAKEAKQSQPKTIDTGLKDYPEITENGPYASYEGSPISKGKFQFDLWEDERLSNIEKVKSSEKENSRYLFMLENDNKLNLSGMWDWERLRSDIKLHGVRNSQLIAVMPTASTAQILGNNEACESFTSNFYLRRVLAGEFKVINKHLVRDLTKLNLWDEDMKKQIIKNDGSIQNINGISDDIKQLYKTSWEISPKVVIDQASDRSPFVDQAQSTNLFMAEPDAVKMAKMHMYSWRRGNKTGMYYLRSKPKANAKNVVNIEKKMETEEEEIESDCELCGA